MRDIIKESQFEIYWTKLDDIVRQLLKSEDLKDFEEFKKNSNLIGLESQTETLVLQRIGEIERESKRNVKYQSHAEARAHKPLLRELKELETATGEWKSEVLGITIKNNCIF